MVHAEYCHGHLALVVDGKEAVFLRVTGFNLKPVVTCRVAGELDLHAVLVRPKIWGFQRLLRGIVVEQRLDGKCSALQSAGPVLNPAVPAQLVLKPCRAVANGDNALDTAASHGITKHTVLELNPGALQPFDVGLGTYANHDYIGGKMPAISQPETGDFAVGRVKFFNSNTADQIPPRWQCGAWRWWHPCPDPAGQ